MYTKCVAEFRPTKNVSGGNIVRPSSPSNSAHQNMSLDIQQGPYDELWPVSCSLTRELPLQTPEIRANRICPWSGWGGQIGIVASPTPIGEDIRGNPLNCEQPRSTSIANTTSKKHGNGSRSARHCPPPKAELLPAWRCFIFCACRVCRCVCFQKRLPRESRMHCRILRTTTLTKSDL
jgi:hypothetical protein